MKKIALATAAAALVVVTLAAPASAKDSGWGCGGACRVVTHR